MAPVDLRSDTCSPPTAAMRAAMATARWGNGILGEDVELIALEERVAALLGKRAAVWLPSGVMGNQIAMHVLVGPSGLVLTGSRHHVVMDERGFAEATVEPLPDSRGLPDRDALARRLARAREEEPERGVAIVVENPLMHRGGLVHTPAELAEVAALGAPVHLDGARLLNAAHALGLSPAALARDATLVLLTLSKGIGAPAGSVLAGDVDTIEACRRRRLQIGGLMASAAPLAVAAQLALDDVDARIPVDHARARRIADAAAEALPGCIDPNAVRTNIVMLDVTGARSSSPGCASTTSGAWRSTSAASGSSPTQASTTMTWTAPVPRSTPARRRPSPPSRPRRRRRGPVGVLHPQVPAARAAQRRSGQVA